MNVHGAEILVHENNVIKIDIFFSVGIIKDLNFYYENKYNYF